MKIFDKSTALFWSGALFCVLLFSFRLNGFYLVPDKYFHFFQADSQSMVEAKLADMAAGQGLVEGGFLRVNKPFFNGRVEVCDPALNVRYNSQFGLQGLVMAAVSRFGEAPPARIMEVAEWVVSVLSAVTVALFFWMLMKKWGVLAALPAALILAGSVDLVLYGRNVFWVVFLFFLPYLVALWLYPRVLAGQIPRKWLWGMIFAVVTFKCLCGYEFMSNLTLSAGPVLLLMGIREKLAWKKIIADQCWAAGSCVAAFFAAMFLHLLLLTVSLGGVDEAVSAVGDRINKRVATADPRALGGKEYAVKYLRPGIGTVFIVLKYLSEPAVNLGSYPPFGDEDYAVVRATYYGLTGLGFGVAALAFWAVWHARLSERNKRLLWGIVWSLPMAWLASVSWIFAAKYHCIEHFHLASVMFCFPFMLHVCYCLAALLSTLADELSVHEGNRGTGVDGRIVAD